MITSRTPDDWRDLQDQVAKILAECGFNAKVEKTVTLTRGEVELDVLAEEVVDGRKNKIACECKHWKTSVPKEVVHSFRTVVSDLGANVGYIISTSGFQSGSFPASGMTNIQLVTWEEFQLEFLETWFENHFVKKITDELDPLMTYTETILPKWFEGLTREGKDEYIKLRNKYELFGMLIMNMFSTYSRILEDKGIIDLPLKERVKSPDSNGSTIPDEILEARGYRQLLNLALEFGGQGIEEFRSVKTEYSV